MLLVLHQGAIGDFLLTLSVAGAVRDQLGNPPIEVIASAASARWAANCGLVDAYHSPESVGLHTLFTCEGQLDTGLTQLLQRATVVASFLGGPDEPIHAHLATSTPVRVVSVDPRPRRTTLAADLHITEQWSTDIRAQGIPIGNPIPLSAGRKGSGVFECTNDKSEPSESDNADRVRMAQGLPTPSRAIILHPGSGGRHKCWPIEHFLGLADALTRDNVRIAWMLGPAEREPGDERFAAIARRIVGTGEELIVEDDLTAAAERIASATLYIGNDGGMTHVAAATGVPTLAIYVATDPRVWRPLGENVRVMDARASSARPHDVYAIAARILAMTTNR